MKLNKIYHSDNLVILKKMKSNMIDLIYCDPPYFSQRNYIEFNDTWNSIDEYLAWMKVRLVHMHRVLKPTGSIYLHCDWHASHYLKVIMDDIFGYKNFRNEIVWSYHTGGASKKHFSRKHDVILFYSKSDKYYFNTDEIHEEFREDKTDHFKDVDKNGNRCRIREVNGKEYYYYLEDGKIPTDVWEIASLNAASKERKGYPTQKPQALLERIIKASSNKRDLVLDPFCGCGTAVEVAQKLGRNFIAIDVSPKACRLTKRSLK